MKDVLQDINKLMDLTSLITINLFLGANICQ